MRGSPSLHQSKGFRLSLNEANQLGRRAAEAVGRRTNVGRASGQGVERLSEQCGKIIVLRAHDDLTADASPLPEVGGQPVGRPIAAKLDGQQQTQSPQRGDSVLSLAAALIGLGNKPGRFVQKDDRRRNLVAVLPAWAAAPQKAADALPFEFGHGQSGGVCHGGRPIDAQTSHPSEIRLLSARTGFSLGDLVERPLRVSKQSGRLLHHTSILGQRKAAPTPKGEPVVDCRVQRRGLSWSEPLAAGACGGVRLCEQRLAGLDKRGDQETKSTCVRKSFAARRPL